MSCSKTLVSILLVVVNFVFAAAGLLMLAFGIAAAVKPQSIVEIFSVVPKLSENSKAAGFNIEETMQSSAVFMIILGAIVAVIGLFGCVGACCKVKWMLAIYIIVLVVVLLAEIALIIYASVFPNHLESNTRPVMYESLQKYKTDGSANNTIGNYTLPTDDHDLAWASLQFEAACCGAHGYKDYQNVTFVKTDFQPSASKMNIPVSCCKLKAGAGHIATMKTDFVDLNQCLMGYEEFINTQDCYSALQDLMRKYSTIAIGIAAAIIAIEVILILLALYLCRSVATTQKSQTI
jgi:tetraspanin-18